MGAMLRRSARIALVVALVLPLAACVEGARIPDAQPSSSVAPLFASDEEALAAATAAYEEYLAVLDGALQEPLTVEPSFEKVAEGQARDSALESIREFVREGLRISGPRVVGNVDLQQWSSHGDAEVTAYFCEDISGVLLLNANGDSLTEGDRPDYTVFEATVAFVGDQGLVVEREFWSNEESC
ncbi:MAG: hypothetical protein Q7J04_07515 [Microcella sp.]|nr:hypothetical protein [Microcella sp.]